MSEKKIRNKKENQRHRRLYTVVVVVFYTLWRFVTLVTSAGN